MVARANGIYYSTHDIGSYYGMEASRIFFCDRDVWGLQCLSPTMPLMHYGTQDNCILKNQAVFVCRGRVVLAHRVVPALITFVIAIHITFVISIQITFVIAIHITFVVAIHITFVIAIQITFVIAT